MKAWKNSELKRIYEELNIITKNLSLNANNDIEVNVTKAQQLTKLLHLQSSLIRLDQGERRLSYQMLIAMWSIGSSFVFNLLWFYINK
ncbi:hypothetical protein LFX15_17760 [Leptospira levettii]|uniref:hypothetical protein n=1 Tax=Leptospira levettii TaxID=2023178 RepID=UPI001EE9D827|nr:hypothetical protein [Leptospira levettii]MCG6150150.1 hypothetical protein [Leptospira levettii]